MYGTYIFNFPIFQIMKTMCYRPGYHQNGHTKSDQTLIKIIPNTDMIGKICPNVKMTPPCASLRQ